MSWLVADGHVHFHAGFSLDVFLAAASKNLSKARDALRLEEPCLSFLLFSEVGGVDVFGEWASKAGAAHPPSGPWSFEETLEEASLLARPNADSDGPHQQNRTLVIVSGRQLATREGLEVLALGTRMEPPEAGLPLAEALAWASEWAGITVLPWGFGKWSFSRGRLVRETVASLRDFPWFLGDNGNRLRAAPLPRGLQEGTEAGKEILPGSDPFPLPGQNGRVGSTGFAVPGKIDLEKPFSELIDGLAASSELRRFVKGSGIPSFLVNQSAMLLRKTVRNVVKR